MRKMVWFGFVLVSVRTFGVIYDLFLLSNNQIRHQATHKVGCQSGVHIQSLQYSSGVQVGIYGLIYSLMTPEGNEEEVPKLFC